MGIAQEDAGGAAVEPTVFLSYARGDQPFAQKLIDALEKHGFRVWWDGLISGGHEFSEKIETALASADAIVVLWSAESAHSHWVRDEASFARDHHRLVPVTIDGSDAPLGFRQLHRLNLSHWHGDPSAPAFQQLCHSIRAVTGSGEAGEARTPERRWAINRRHALFGGTAAVLLAAGGGYMWLGGMEGIEAASIAVIPFRNLSDNPVEEYFSDGLAEELRTTLSQAEQLQVAAQASSDTFRDGKVDAKAMAKALGVAYLVEGSVRRSLDTIRVATRIVDGRSGLDRWSQTFDRPAADSLAVQSDIAAFVTDAVLAHLDKDLRPAERIGGTKRSAAFDAFLRGSALYRLAAGKNSDFEALAQFDQAVAADPDYAAAHAARSRVLTFIANNYATTREIPGYYDKAIEAARKAITLAPDLAEGYSALGFVMLNGRLDAQAAEAPYQRSYELGYGNADILSSYATFAARTGHFDEGREAIARAAKLDPLNANVFRNAGFLEYAARDYAAAESQFRTALSINPKARNVHAALGDIALVRGDLPGAKAQYAAEGDVASKARGLAIVDMKAGNSRAAEAALSALTKEGGDTINYQLAQVMAQWGRGDDALGHLEKALALRDAGLVRMRNDPLLDPVRNDARFTTIERRIGFS